MPGTSRALALHGKRQWSAPALDSGILATVDGDDALQCLPGGHLDTVSFVMNYVEFHISYNVLRALTAPIVELQDGSRFCFPDSGSRDALCSLIDTEVESAHEVGSFETRDRRIELRTDGGHLLSLPFGPTPSDQEWAQLVPADRHGRLEISEMFVW